MSLEKLLSIRHRLSNLTMAQRQPATATSPDGAAAGAPTPGGDPSKTDQSPTEKELTAIVRALDEVIADYKQERWADQSVIEELKRTTSKPLEPPKPGPHEIKWGF